MNICSAVRISGIGLNSCFGIGYEAFADAARASLTEAPPAPGSEAFRVPNFDSRDYLGRKGTRDVDRVTGLMLAAVAGALGSSHISGRMAPERTGVVIGTSTGGVDSIFNYARDTYVQERAYMVNPAHLANVTLNCAAGVSAIWYGLKGGSLTVAGGRLSGLLALKYAQRILQRRRMDALVVGCVEEACPPFLSAYRTVSASVDAAVSPGEGAVALGVERVGGEGGLADISCLVESWPRSDEDERARRLAALVRQLLDSRGVRREDIEIVSMLPMQCSGSGVESDALDSVFEHLTVPPIVHVHELVGDTYSASFGFQVAAVIAGLRSTRRGQCGLITVSTVAGQIGCALVGAVTEGDT